MNLDLPVVKILPHLLPFSFFLFTEPPENCRYQDTSSLNTSACAPRNKDILLCNHNTIIMPKTFDIDTIVLSNI